MILGKISKKNAILCRINNSKLKIQHSILFLPLQPLLAQMAEVVDAHG
jgi:hypothetical protein